MRAFILCGGLGMRLRQVVSSVPKPMAPVVGRPFLEYLLDFWITQGVSDFVLAVGYKHESICQHFGQSYRGIPVSFSVEDAPLGTGGALLLALQRFPSKDSILLLNGDTYFEVSLIAMKETMEAKSADGVIALFEGQQDERYAGVALDDAGRIVSLSSQQSEGVRYFNGGVYLLGPEFFNESRWQREGTLSLETEWIPGALRAGMRIYGYPGNGPFIDIGVPEDYARAPRVVRSH